ncbi:uncharacterized protein LOC142073063 [Caretta caretta]|uniref:uncharacterized protein LOC142073063 n=1 Tax=Caretta caretta TaxID=8467 RepID=UPI003F4C2EC9
MYAAQLTKERDLGMVIKDYNVFNKMHRPASQSLSFFPPPETDPLARENHVPVSPRAAVTRGSTRREDGGRGSRARPLLQAAGSAIRARAALQVKKGASLGEAVQPALRHAVLQHGAARGPAIRLTQPYAAREKESASPASLPPGPPPSPPALEPGTWCLSAQTTPFILRASRLWTKSVRRRRPSPVRRRRRECPRRREGSGREATQTGVSARTGGEGAKLPPPASSRPCDCPRPRAAPPMFTETLRPRRPSRVWNHSAEKRVPSDSSALRSPPPSCCKVGQWKVIELRGREATARCYCRRPELVSSCCGRLGCICCPYLLRRRRCAATGHRALELQSQV